MGSCGGRLKVAMVWRPRCWMAVTVSAVLKMTCASRLGGTVAPVNHLRGVRRSRASRVRARR